MFKIVTLATWLLALLLAILFMYEEVANGQLLPSWGHVNSDKYRSNSIQFYKPHKEWITKFQDTFASSGSVAFDVNRGKALIFDLYRYNLTFIEVDLLNGNQSILQYAAPPSTMSPVQSNLVIDSNSNAYLTLIGSDGTKILIKADLTNTKNILYKIVEQAGMVILLSEDSTILITYTYSHVIAYETKNFKQLWSFECDNEPIDILLVSRDLYVATGDQTIHKLDIQTGKLISRFTIPDYLSGAGVDSMSFSGLPGWLILGMNLKDSSVVGVVNVDAQKADMVTVLYGDAKKLVAETSNIVSSVIQNGTSVHIFSALSAYTGFSGGYFGTHTSFDIQKDNSIARLEIDGTWQNNKLSGFTVASAQPNRQSVILMDATKYLVISNDQNGKVLKTASSKITGDGSRFVVSAGNQMVYAFSFTNNQVIMEAASLA
ncbi:hypothetical protein NAEGRDRAFT_79425 [Naegleria gruberi]|uniref:Uncharacterized protein n=1 Tax=Naegleria gruberi TaxID=5762 RepID=D2VCD9_NAEGR|nr:uncharacterized protein NAEGRDRAFT_79425 [Naegleria gruberi]EFC45402.1 hypothetical protein NAEGRDRAFT_79425 [Naegleria gruberi]|eukprot:XP_002678146.1 hypothetical protein NAEGRDRAFT_79425 [Naegleria gruberi strain NEG-M]